MKAYTKRAQKVLEFVLKEIPSDEKQCKGHDLNHVLRVWKIGMKIGKKEKADLSVLEPTLLLHDIKRPSDKKGEKDHAFLSAEVSAKILPNFNYTKKEIKKICNAIKTHSRSSLSDMPKTLEGKIVYDADKQDGIGKLAIKRVLSLGTGRNWNAKQCAEWYLGRIIDVAKNEPLYTETSKNIWNKKLKHSLSWCKRKLGKTKYSDILKKYGLKKSEEIYFN